jgi:hypothetical protein
MPEYWFFQCRAMPCPLSLLNFIAQSLWILWFIHFILLNYSLSFVLYILSAMHTLYILYITWNALQWRHTTNFVTGNRDASPPSFATICKTSYSFLFAILYHLQSFTIAISSWTLMISLPLHEESILSARHGGMLTILHWSVMGIDIILANHARCVPIYSYNIYLPSLITLRRDASRSLLESLTPMFDIPTSLWSAPRESVLN